MCDDKVIDSIILTAMRQNLKVHTAKYLTKRDLGRGHDDVVIPEVKNFFIMVCEWKLFYIG